MLVSLISDKKNSQSRKRIVSSPDLSGYSTENCSRMSTLYSTDDTHGNNFRINYF